MPVPDPILPVAARLTAAAMLLGVAIATSAEASAQAIDDRSRLAGVERVDVRAEAQWDELITMEAGGATPEQFLEALRATFQDAIAGADAAPGVVEGSAVTVACHVDTFYDTGLIVYAVRVQTEHPGADGSPVITWIRSWVGSYTVQQLHLMFRLGEQCAEGFLEEWRSAN